MQELHELQEEKLLLSQIKNKSTIEKVHRKSVKRASKKGNEGDIDQMNREEISSIVVEQQLKVVHNKSSTIWSKSIRQITIILPSIYVFQYFSITI